MNYVELAQAHVAELYPTIVFARPRLADLPAGAIIGTWAYSVPGKVRFILDKSIQVATGVLPADVSRAWVRDTYKLPLKRRKNQLERGYSVPLHARRGQYGDCAYVDIKAAYLKILSLGYDVEYLRKKYIYAEPCAVPAEIRANKLCYSIAVAMSGTKISNLEVMGKNGLFDHKPLNIYSNPSLYNLAQETLNGIGGEILSVMGEKVVYANTDGFIVRSGCEKYVQEIIQSWGFESQVKAFGETWVRGVGSYRCGELETRRFDPKAADFTGPLMPKDERLWLKRRWIEWTNSMQR